MKPLVAALAGVVLIMTAACGGGSPASTTPVGPSSAISVSGPAPAVQSIGGTTRWSCFAGSRAGIFASAGCPSRIAVGGALLGEAALIPFFPTGLAGSVSGSTVTLTWNVASNDPAGPPTSFVVQAGSSSGASNLASFDTGGSGTTLTVTDVPAGTYYVRVQAKNSSGVSGASNEIIITVTGGPSGCTSAPSAPSGLASSVSGGTVTLFWTAPGGACAATAYVLQAGSSSGLNNLADFNTGSSATTYVAGGVPAGTYFVRVRAVNGIGSSVPSNEVTVIVAPPSVTGRWVGVTPDGMILPAGSANVCEWEWDFELDLTQSGTEVTGRMTYQFRRINIEDCGGNIGQMNGFSLVDGRVGPGTISFGAVADGDALSFPTFTFSGTFTATRMTGTLARGDHRGSFAANR